MTPDAVMLLSHVLALCECVAVDVQLVGGPATTVTLIFTSAVSAELEMEFNPPLVIDATTQNATVTLDVAKWFLDGSGAVIDPNTATAGSSALQTIEDNIRRSFHAFEDNDESGVDDNTEHHG